MHEFGFGALNIRPDFSLFAPVMTDIEESNGRLSPRKAEHLRDALDAVLRKDIDEFAGNVRKLSPRELDICEMIREGMTSKSIAAELSIAAQTVHKHRQLIRKKLQINNKAVNLASFLRSRP